jgi:hypothetical protein
MSPTTTNRADGLGRDLQYSRELAERVEREAEDATRLPVWFWPLAVVALAGSVLLSAVFPMGWAS